MMNPMFLSILASTTTNRSVGSFLQAAQQSVAHYGNILTSLIGVAMVIVGVYQVAKNLMSQGRGQSNWVVTIALILVGGALALTTGWTTVGNLVETGQKTVDDMAQGIADDTGSPQDPFQRDSGS